MFLLVVLKTVTNFMMHNHLPGVERRAARKSYCIIWV